eukprot:CFRG5365T1
MFRALVAATFSACAVNAAIQVPVFIWSPEGYIPSIDRNEVSTPSSEIINQITKSTEELSTVVLFIQDKLSNFDFSRYAGSDEVSSPKLRTLLSQSNSQIYANVDNAGEKIEKHCSRMGIKHEIEGASDLEGLELSTGMHTVVVRLGSPATTGTVNQFSINDNLIDDVINKVSALSNNKYIAVLTAMEPSENLDLNFVHTLSMSKHRSARAANDTGDDEIDPATVQNRYFSAPIITVLLTILIFVFLTYFATYMLSEIQTPIRFQDAGIALIGKE